MADMIRLLGISNDFCTLISFLIRINQLRTSLLGDNWDPQARGTNTGDWQVTTWELEARKANTGDRQATQRDDLYLC